MVHQATLSDDRQQRPAKVVARKVGDLTHDLATLAELQGQLLAEDARQMGRGLVMPVALGIGAIVLLLAGVPLLLVAIVQALVEYARMQPWAAYLATGLGTICTCGVLAYVAKRRLQGIAHTCQRSREELAMNLRWLKRELTHGRSDDGAGGRSTTARHSNGVGPM